MDTPSARADASARLRSRSACSSRHAARDTRSSSATIYYAEARRINSVRYQGYVNYLTGSTQVDTMTDSAGTVLSTVTAVDSQSMRFDWKAFG